MNFYKLIFVYNIKTEIKIKSKMQMQMKYNYEYICMDIYTHVWMDVSMDKNQLSLIFI